MNRSIQGPAVLNRPSCPYPSQGPPGQQINWRFLVPDSETLTFADGHFGPQTFIAGKDFGDFVVWHHDNVPAYHLAVVVDDDAMQTYWSGVLPSLWQTLLYSFTP